MVNKCIAFGCTTGYASNPEKLQVFYVPKNDQLRKAWEIAIHRDNFKVKSGHVVCIKHFLPEDILTERLLLGPDGSILGKSPYAKPQLRPGAIPQLLLGRPEKCPKKRRFLNRNNLGADESTTNKRRHLEKENIQPVENEINIQDIQSDDVPNEDNNLTQNLFRQLHKEESSFKLLNSWSRTPISSNNEKGITFVKFVGKKGKNHQIDSVCLKEIIVSQKMTFIIKICGNVIDPEEFGISDQMTSIENVEKIINCVDQRQVCQGVSGLDVNESNENLLKNFTFIDKIGVLRHKKCRLFLAENSAGSQNKERTQCCHCKSVKSVLNKKIIRCQRNVNSKYIQVKQLSPKKRRKLEDLRRRLRNASRSQQKASAKIRLLKGEMKIMQEKMSNVKKETIDQLLANEKNISANEITAVKEIFKAAAVNDPRGRRYSDEWIVLCILLHMRSPVTYRFILENKILPFPDVRTIRKYLSNMDCPCGFDPRFFEILKEHFDQKSDLELHGLLVLDEMKVRQNLLVDTTTMSYKGLEDFGNIVPNDFDEKMAKDKGLEEFGKNVPKKGKKKKTDHKDLKKLNDNVTIDEKMANYGLVLMFQPLYDNYSQPIAVFASNGPTKGVILAKLVVQAIALLEKAGAKVHGIVADGGKPNRKMWTELGCSGKINSFKNFFEHPTNYSNEESSTDSKFDFKRKVFFFSDAPHLIKTIRNRLANAKMLQMKPDGDLIEWEHFKILHQLDSVQPKGRKVCPKITSDHVNLENDNFLKMRVSLSLQLFSNSAARGLRFYKEYDSRLITCGATIEFCTILNNMFDDLNRTSVETAVRLSSDDIQVLRDTLKWLNDWEENVQNQLIEKELFITSDAAEGLRMTLNSTLDLIQYLLEDLKIEYVLTGRINQDCLERFFGTIRLAGGTNDHPATPTFLQIYKILSFYSVLKPPKFGNCSLPDTPNRPLISMSRLKEIYNGEKKNKNTIIAEIKSKLNIVIANDSSDFSDFTDAMDHNYDLPIVRDCLMYFLTGQVCSKFSKYRECEVCQSAFLNSENDANVNFSRLITYEDNQSLQQPNRLIFELFKKIEQYFENNCEQKNLFELILSDISKETFQFPCSVHAADVLSYLIQYYLENRMRQFVKAKIGDKKKKNLSHKKQAKLVDY